jgi:16S rRNA (cytosine967-C5)-methyltransferase
VGRVNAGRAAAYARLAAEAEKYPDLGLEPLELRHVPERDQALAHAIYDAAVRRWITIRHLARLHLRQPWEGLEPAVVGALLGGAAQLLFFDRVPPHAALDETVEWTKSSAPKAAGLVNAVLRRIASMIEREPGGEPVRREAWTNARDELPLADGRALRLDSACLPEEEMPRAAAATGVPLWQVRAWSDHLGEDDALHAAWHSIAGGPTVLNVQAAARAPEGEAILPHHAPDHRVFAGSRADLLALLKRYPDVWVQDSTSAAAIALVEGSEAGLVVDLCAGRGTKTRQLLARFPAARIVACEVSEPRLRDLDSLAASSAGRLEVRYPPEILGPLRARCDLVVADVPCSNSGVLARRVEARHRCSARQLARITAQQKEILQGAAPLLGPSGLLLYSTCSLEPQENQHITAWLVANHGLRIIRERLILPAGGPGRPPTEYRDGGYAALLARVSGQSPTAVAGIH